MATPNLTLTIAGSDPSGGAGLQADLAVFAQHGLRGAAVVTALTVQSSAAVRRVHPVPSDQVAEQLRAVLEDHALAAAKIGMLGSAGTPAALALVWEELGEGIPLVLDPVLFSTSGTALLEEAGLDALRARLIPLATVITPNLPEAAALLGWESVAPATAAAAARDLLALGPRCVVVTGGHASDGGDEIVDAVAFASGEISELRGPRIETQHRHGTGCLFSAGITAALARGTPLPAALAHGRACASRGLRSGREGAVWLDGVPGD